MKTGTVTIIGAVTINGNKVDLIDIAFLIYTLKTFTERKFKELQNVLENLVFMGKGNGIVINFIETLHKRTLWIKEPY